MSLSTLRKRDETPLSIDLQTLLKHLSRLVEWETFGALVGVQSEELRRIKEEHGSVQSRVMHLLDYWIKNDDNVSWSRVIEALKAIPEEKHLAENVSEKWGQSKVIESTAQIILKEEEELALTLDEIRIKFTRLVFNIEKALRKEVDFDDVLSFVSNYLQVVIEPLPENIRQLFNRLQPHYCFMSYKILKVIVCEFIKEAMGERTEKYSKALQKWLESTTVQEFKAAVEKAANPETIDPSPSQCLVVLKLEGEWLRVTLKNLWKLLEYLFGKNSSILTRIRIKEGSILVHLFAPQSDLLPLLALSSKKYKEMAYIGIRSIRVGGLCFSTADVIIGAPFTFEISLGIAIQDKCNPALVQFLLEIGTDPDGEDALHTPLILAAMFNNMEALSLLMEYNVDVFMFNKRQVSAIHMAAYNGNVEIVKILLKAGVPPDHHDPVTKFTPLMTAASSNQEEVVYLLIRNGADKDFQNTEGYSALMLACYAGSTLSALVLLESEANPNLKTKGNQLLNKEGGETALNLACQSMGLMYDEDVEGLVKLLLKYNADPNISSDSGTTPLMIACYFKHHKVVHLLLQSGANVNLQADHHIDNGTTLLVASKNNDITLVLLLLSANADVNVQDAKGRTALYWACRYGNDEMIKRLLKAKADPKICTLQRESPLALYTISRHKKSSTVVALLKSGADPNVLNPFFTPLHAACASGHKDIVQLLLKAKANVNALDRYGNTPLYNAARSGFEQLVEQLLSAGADIEIEKNLEGWTPVFIAAARGHLGIVKFLVENGANIKRNRYGETPQAIAVVFGHIEVANFLSQAAAFTAKVPFFTATKAKNIQSEDSKSKKVATKKNSANEDDIFSYYNDFISSISSGSESIKQFHDNEKKHFEYSLESLETTKSRPKIVISSN